MAAVPAGSRDKSGCWGAAAVANSERREPRQRPLHYPRRCAAHVPEHLPLLPCPLHTPLPVSEDNRPEPLADWRNTETCTRTAPCGETRPTLIPPVLERMMPFLIRAPD